MGAIHSKHNNLKSDKAGMFKNFGVKIQAHNLMARLYVHQLHLIVTLNLQPMASM